MRKVAVCLLLFSAALFAQSADTAYFRAVMLPDNEVPPTGVNARGVADIIAHVVRDSSGQITNGTVDFLVRVTFPADVTATGLHIHNGPAGVNAGVVINTGIGAGVNSRVVKAGGDVIHIPVQVTGNTTADLNALRGLFQDPTQYYVNIHTTDFSNGVMRGQLQRAIGTVLMGQMSSDNEVPLPKSSASGVSVVVAIATLDASGALASGEVYQQTTYSVEDRGTFTGFHIHPGVAGTTGPASLATPLPAGTPIDPSGSGLLGPFATEILLTNATQVLTFTNLLYNPAGDYINVHTNTNPGGVMRAQLRPTDSMSFPVIMDSANEPAANVKATAPAVVTLHTLRNEDGSVAAGTVFFDVDFRFPGAAQFTGLHIHDAGKGVNGSISIPMVPTYDAAFSTDTGFGNYFNWTQAIPNVAALSDVVHNPENHYVNLHTTIDGGGAVRAQLAPVVSSPPVLGAVIAANLDKTATTVAPGGLITIFGTNLVKVATDLSGWAGKTLPASLNGASMTIGGKSAPLYYVSPGQINAQVPVDVPAGAQAVVVNNGVGPSASFTVNVAAAAPAIFFSPVAAVLKNSDFSLVSSTNPVRAGDAILIYATGLGLTTPALPTGGLVPAGTIANTAAVTATVGGQNAAVIYSIASPGAAGLYQVAVTVPSGVTGSVPVVIQQGSAKSNAVNINVQ